MEPTVPSDAPSLSIKQTLRLPGSQYYFIISFYKNKKGVFLQGNLRFPGYR
jgi:hypothetical protein